jgi:Bacterial Ig-like domain
MIWEAIPDDHENGGPLAACTPSSPRSWSERYPMTVYGVYVTDTWHGWKEIHPITQVTSNGQTCTREPTSAEPSDTTPPDTTINSGPSGTVQSSSASFSFSSSESGSKFECRLDSGSWGACTSPKEYTGLSNGSHTFEVRATDSAGNTDSTPDSRTWTVDTTSSSGDTTAPTVSSTSPANYATNVARTTSVTATFSEEMDPATLTTSTVTLVRSGTTTPISATVSYDEASRKVTLKPAASLASYTGYRVTVKGGSSGAKDKAGNPLAADTVWSFWTGAS